MTATHEPLEYYAGLPYAVEVRRDEEGRFAKVPGLPGCVTYADTFEELGPMVEDAKRGWIEDALEHGDPVPEPKTSPGSSTSGCRRACTATSRARPRRRACRSTNSS